MTGWPPEISEPLIECHVSPRWLRRGIAEAANLAQLYDEMRQAGPLPDVPMIVLCSMASTPSNGQSRRAIRGAAASGDRRQVAALHRAGSIGAAR